MKLVLYSKEYIDELEELLLEFSVEVYGYNQCDVDEFVKYHSFIYLAVGSDDKIVGFTSFSINNYYGLRASSVGNDYVYLKPNYRNSKLVYLMMIQAGKVVEDLQMPLEHYIASEDSAKLMKRLPTEAMYTVYLTTVDDAVKESNRLQRIVRIKK